MDRYEVEYEDVISSIIFWKGALEHAQNQVSADFARKQIAHLEAKADRLAEEIEA
jgi:hypothetical protein